MREIPVRRRRWPIFLPFGLLILLAVVWSGIWYFAARAAERNIAAWIEAEARQGRVYTCTDRRFGGYPFRIELRCTDPVAEIQAAGLVLKAKEFLALAQVYQPNLVIAEIAGPLSVAPSGEAPRLVGEWRLAQASVRLSPLPDRLSIALDDAKFAEGQGPAGSLASAKRLEVHLRLDPASRDSPALDLAATVREGLIPPAGALGARPFDGEMTAILHGLGDLRPKPLPVRLKEWQAAGGRLEITNVRVRQADAVAAAKGQLALSPGGRLDGALVLTLAGFDQVVQALIGGQGRNTGLMAVAGLSLLGKPAEIDGKRAIEVPLRFRDGAVSFGPIPLGKTPPLY
jgi:hypothetical protein